LTDTEIVTTRLADAHGVHYTARDVGGRTDRPLEMGGKNAGLMASEHVLVALASCTTTSAIKVASKRGVTLTDVRIEAAMDFDERGLVSAIRLRIEVASPDDEAAVLKVFDLAERVCTVSRLLALAPIRTIVMRKP
jgi:uncharacterized OsmC-like protein